MAPQELSGLNYYEKDNLVKSGRYLDVFKDDRDADIRQAVAQQGAFLDELKNDPVDEVRVAVARHGVFLGRT